MKSIAESAGKGSRTISALRMAAAAILFGLLSLAGASIAGGHEHNASAERHVSDYESKIYGIVESLPQDRVGTWVVNGREIVVTKDTRIKEKHGKAEAGAYVEAEGSVTGKTFIAYEIEVKRAK